MIYNTASPDPPVTGYIASHTVPPYELKEAWPLGGGWRRRGKKRKKERKKKRGREGKRGEKKDHPQKL